MIIIKSALKLQAIKYVIVTREIWLGNMEAVLLKCVDEVQSVKILNKTHSRVCGGHFMAKIIAHKLTRVGFWWLALFKDAHELMKKCDSCQRFTRKLKLFVNLPLRLVEVQAPFQQRQFDFLQEIMKKSNGGHSWILVATIVFTKSVEAIPTKRETSKVVMDFILNNIIIRIGFPK